MLTAIGTIKIGTAQRNLYFLRAIESLAPIADLLVWRLNIVGEFAPLASHNIEMHFSNADITCDDTTDTYSLQRAQMDAMTIRNPVITWQEDHWFICPHQNLFRYLLNEFMHSSAEVLTVTHLMTSWERKRFLSYVGGNALYQKRYVGEFGQDKLWTEYSGAYVTGSPAIYKWELASDILEFKKNHMSQTTLPEFELSAEEGRKFLKRRPFIEMIPTFHVFREVAQEAHSEEALQRAIPEHKALSWIRLRDGANGCGDRP